MMQLVKEQRALVDELVVLLKKIGEINDQIPSGDYKTDMLILIGQHRHTFDEQLVTDHSGCLSIQSIMGSHEGITGGLMMLALTEPASREMILQAAAYVIDAKLA